MEQKSKEKENQFENDMEYETRNQSLSSRQGYEGRITAKTVCQIGKLVDLVLGDGTEWLNKDTKLINDMFKIINREFSEKSDAAMKILPIINGAIDSRRNSKGQGSFSGNIGERETIKTLAA